MQKKLEKSIIEGGVVLEEEEHTIIKEHMKEMGKKTHLPRTHLKHYCGSSKKSRLDLKTEGL